MSALEIQTGNPPTDGRYVAFVRCQGRQVADWFEPIIATWHGGRWHCGRMVFGWIGPLPVGKCIDLIETPAEYDL